MAGAEEILKAFEAREMAKSLDLEKIHDLFEPFLDLDKATQKSLQKYKPYQAHIGKIDETTQQARSVLEGLKRDGVPHFAEIRNEINRLSKESKAVADAAFAEQGFWSKLFSQLPIGGQAEVHTAKRWGVPAAFGLGAIIIVGGVYLTHALGVFRAVTEYMGFGKDKTNSIAGFQASKTASAQSAIQVQIQDQAKVEASVSALAESDREKDNRILADNKFGEAKTVNTNIQVYDMPPKLSRDLHQYKTYLPATVDELGDGEKFLGGPMSKLPLGPVKAIAFVDGKPATTIELGDKLQSQPDTVWVVVQASDGTERIMNAKDLDKLPKAANTVGPQSYNSVTIGHATDPHGPPPSVTLQNTSHPGDNMALAFGALGVGAVGGAAFKGRSGAAAGKGPKPSAPDAPKPVNRDFIRINKPEEEAAVKIAEEVIKDAGKASKFVGVAKFLGHKVPIVGAFVAAAAAVCEVGGLLSEGKKAQAGVAAVNGVIDTIGGVGGFFTGFITDGLHEGVRSVAIKLGGEQFRVVSKSGTREMAEMGAGAVKWAAAQRPAAPTAEAAGLHA